MSKLVYHNVRDKSGRFTSAPLIIKKPKRRPSKPGSAGTPSIQEVKTLLSVFLLDVSSSMSSKVHATEEGFNTILENGKKDAETTKVNLVEILSKFGDPGEFDWKVGNVRPFSSINKYYPNQGSTALYDAIGYTIRKTEDSLVLNPTAKVLLTIFTDGEENSSKIWNKQAIKSRIEEKQAQGWTITFMGAGADHFVKKMSGDIGIFSNNTLSYQNTSVGTTTAMRKMSDSRSSYTSKVAAGTDSNIGFFSENSC